MLRKRPRLVALVSLVAFLAANTHASAVFTRLTARSVRQLSMAMENGGSSAASDRSSCCHCRKAAPVATNPTSSTMAGDEDASGPCGPDCPDCHKGPTCPCPGGCASCNVAKVPCFAPPPNFAIVEAFLGDSTEAPPSFYTPPSAGCLARPPRV